MATQTYDLVVIGGGPGGYVAAIRAAQLGMSVACVERAELGGICLNWGCIPTKALLKNAELYRDLKEHGRQFGFMFDNLSFDLSAIIGRSRKVAGRLSNGVDFLFRKNGVTHIAGNAKLIGDSKVDVADDRGNSKHELQAKHIIVATGARPRELPFAPFSDPRIMEYRAAMVPEELPERLVVIGAGAIGVEFAYFYRSFGVDVTIVEMQPRLVPVEDDEIATVLERSFKSAGIKLVLGAKVQGVDRREDADPSGPLGVQVETAEGESKVLEADRLLVAIGVQGNVEGLGLEEQGVVVERGHIQVDNSYHTGAAGIYAIGDVVGPPWLAHVASAEGICCVERIAGHDRPDIPYASIPGCTYCQPEIASVGLTERAVKEEGTPYRVGRFPYRASGKALAAGDDTGMVKVLFHTETGELLGAHLIGHSATEMVHELVLAHTNELTEKEILHTVHAHPTLSESIHEAVGDAYGEAINI